MASARGARAFSLIDLLVSISVIAVLLGLLLPSLTQVKEAARRVQCASNLRQVAIAVQMYGDDHDGQLPQSLVPVVDKHGYQRPSTMMVMHEGDHPQQWDGLGWLVAEQYLSTHVVFYCPSHQGFHEVDQYAKAWRMLDSELVANYDLRPIRAGSFYEQLPSNFALVADGMRTLPDYNHKIGSNVLTADLGVDWREDNGVIASRLPDSDQSAPREGVPSLALWNVLNGDDFIDPRVDRDEGGRRPGDVNSLAPDNHAPAVEDGADDGHPQPQMRLKARR